MYATFDVRNPLFSGFSSYPSVNKEIVISAMVRIYKKASASLLARCFLVYSDHHRMAEMTDLKRSGKEVHLLGIADNCVLTSLLGNSG